jgi:predicted DNA-binding transcriptional regulator YafY
VKTIKEACGIPERTVYRYLNTISEANIPVYFDKDAEAYRLNTETNLAINDISFGESLLTIVALKVLAALVSEHYQRDIESLVTKLVVRQDSEVEAVLGPATDRLTSQLDSIDLTDELSSALIHAAVCCGRKIRLTRSDDPESEQRTGISSPSLHFRDTWRLTDRSLVDPSESTIDDVKKVEVL